MNPLLKFLAAARSLASQGFKKEQIYDFAVREFGEVNSLMQKQIDNIFKPQKPITPKDPDFDNTVQKLGIDDQGKPFNPKDPLNNMATGGRAGYVEGGPIHPRLGELSSGVSSAEEQLQQINQSLQTAETSLGESGPGGAGSVTPSVNGYESSGSSLYNESPAGEVSNPYQAPVGMNPFDNPKITNLNQLPPGQPQKVAEPYVPDQYTPGNSSEPLQQTADPVRQAYDKEVQAAKKQRAEGFMGRVVLPGERSFEDFSSGYNYMQDKPNSLGQLQSLGGGLGGLLGEGGGNSNAPPDRETDMMQNDPRFQNLTTDQYKGKDTMFLSGMGQQSTILPGGNSPELPYPALEVSGMQYAKGGRAGYYMGGQAMVGEDLSDVGHGSDSLMARNMQLSPGSQATTSTGLNYLLGQDNDTVRVPYSKGKLAKKTVDEGRRGFMKAAGAAGAGIAALKTGLLGFGEKVAPVAKEAVEAVSNTAGQAPAYFFKLVDKIRKLGDDAPRLAVKDREKVTTYKEYQLTEDVTTGEQTIQRMKVTDPDSASYYGQPLTEETYMNYKPGKGLADETTKGKTPIDEYEEGTAYIRSDRMNAGEIVEESSGVSDEIYEEVGEAIPEVIRKTKADGGRIGFSKGKLATEGIPALINKIKSLFGNDAITTADKLPIPQKTLDRAMFNKFDDRNPDPNRLLNDAEIEDYEMELGDSETWMMDGTIGEAEKALIDQKEYMANIMRMKERGDFGDFSPSKLDNVNDNQIEEAVQNIFPTGDTKLDAEMAAESLVELNPQIFGDVLLDDLDDITRSKIYGAVYDRLSNNMAKMIKDKRNLPNPTKTLEGIKKTGTIDISDPDIADEFARFMKEKDPKGYKDMEQKIQLESFDPKTKGRKGNSQGGRIGMLSGGGILKAVLKNSADAKGMTVRDFIMAMNPKSIPSNIKNLISKVDLEQLQAGYKSYYENIADMMKTRFDFQKNVEIGKGTPVESLFKNLEKTMDEQSYVPKNVTQDDIAKTELMIKNKFFGKGRKANATGGLATMLGE